MKISAIQLRELKDKATVLLKHQLTPVVCLGLVAGLVVALFMGNNQSVANDNKTAPDPMVMSRLNELQNHLLALEAAAAKPLPEIDLSSLDEKLKSLSLDVSELKQFNPVDLKNGIESRLDEAQQTISNQLNHLNNTVSSIKKAGKPKYLPAKALPFAVVSIDSIQNTPVASIQYDYKTIPMEKGDLLAGWKVVSVDFGDQRIEFENKNHELVLLTQDN